MLPNSAVGNRYGDLLKELYEGIKNNNLPASRVDDIQRIFNDLSMREDKYKAWLRQQDNRIGSDFLDLPFVPIYSSILVEDKASILVNIPSGYKHLVVISNGRTTGVGTSNRDMAARYNGDTGANYDNQILYGVATTVGTTADPGNTKAVLGQLAEDGVTAGKTGASFTVIPNYLSSLFKTSVTISSVPSSTNYVICAIQGTWKNTAVIESITFLASLDNIKSGSALSIYGIL